MKLSRAKKSIFAPVVNAFFITSRLQNRKKKPSPVKDPVSPFATRQSSKAAAHDAELGLSQEDIAIRVSLELSERSAPLAMSELDNEWLVMVDGAARGNPGHAGCGAVILDGNGTVVKELSRYLGHATNNVAEYEALLMGLEALFQLGKRRIRVQSDSQLLVRQLNGEYRVKDEKLKVLFQRAVTLLRQFEVYRILHVPREMNKLADRLANKGIDEAIKRSSLG